MQREQQQQQVESLKIKIVELTSNNDKITTDFNILTNHYSNNTHLMRAELER